MDPAIPKCGQKFVCVDAGGTVELHGQDKMSWTKLSNTLNPLKLGDGINYKHQVIHVSEAKTGLASLTLSVEFFLSLHIFWHLSFV